MAEGFCLPSRRTQSQPAEGAERTWQPPRLPSADPPDTARAPPARAVSYGPPLSRCRTCSEPTGKLFSRRAARRGAQTGGDADARHGTARRTGRARVRVAVGRVGAAQQRCGLRPMLCTKENGRRRAASSSSIRVGTWKLNRRLPDRGDDEVVRHVVNGLQFQWYGVGQLIAVCFMSTHFF